MRILTLFVRHGREKYAGAEEQLDAILARQLPTVERHTIIVDNALTPGCEPFAEGSSVVIGGDNSSWEFSAWDHGIRFLGEQIWSYDLVHLVTSAFNTLYTDYLSRFDEAMLRSIIRRPVCVGHIDCYNQPIRILSFISQHWIRTSFLFIPPAEFLQLRSVVSIKEPSAFFGNGPEEPFGAAAPLSANYQKYILDWLTGGDIGQGSTWHSKFALNSQSWPGFQAKATAILNEHVLAIRLRAQGTRVIDTTWLATQLLTKNADAVDWGRSWRAQLAERDQASLIVA